jgi:hypothetical protein
MSADLEREAREAAEAIAGDTYARGSIYWDRCVTDCSRAFIAAATLREKEIEEQSAGYLLGRERRPAHRRDRHPAGQGRGGVRSTHRG